MHPTLHILGLQNFALTEIIKHDHKIHYIGQKFTPMEIWDQYYVFKQNNFEFGQNDFLTNYYLLRNLLYIYAQTSDILEWLVAWLLFPPHLIFLERVHQL
jgi:hypothetical protein